jgi:uncharacterized membrane protein
MTGTTEGFATDLSQLGELERAVIGKFLQRKAVARNIRGDEQATFGQRTADRVAAFGGSWAFIGLFALVLAAWIAWNVVQRRGFDPFPFILLNLVLSCIAAIQAPLILMSQNRQADKDRQRAEADFAVNLKAEMEVLALHDKLDDLREKRWRELVAQQEAQIALLQRLLAERGG